MSFGADRERAGTEAWWILPTVPLLAAAIAFAWTLHGELQRLYGMTASAWDLAYDQQVIWNVSQGQGFYSSFARANFLGIHFELIFVLLAAIEKVWASPAVLLIFSSAGLAATAPAAYLFFRAILPADRAESRVARGRARGPDPFLGRDPGGRARLLPPGEHGAGVRADGCVGRNQGPPRDDVALLPSDADVQGGPGLYGGRRGHPDVGVWLARGEAALALHPLPRGGMVPDRYRHRAAALSQWRLHRLRLLPVAHRARSEHRH